VFPRSSCELDAPGLLPAGDLKHWPIFSWRRAGPLRAARPCPTLTKAGVDAANGRPAAERDYNSLDAFDDGDAEQRWTA
jgi:hypothetical protein